MDVRLPRLLDAQLGEVVRLHPVSMSIEDNLTPLSTASMTLAEGEHVRLHDWLELYTDRGSAGIFRVRSVTETYTADSSVEMEHGACVLGDAILPGEGTLSGTPGEIVTQMLAHQTMKVAGRVPWVFGSSAVSGAQSFDYDNNNILSALIEFVESIDGCALDFDQSAFPWRVNIIQKETTPSCEGRLSRNLRSVSVTLDDSELCTRIYCDKLPAPGYIDGPNIAVWGGICKTISATDDVTQESLTDYIQRYLEDHKDPKVSIEIDADDFSTVTGEPIDRFVKGRLFRLALPDYGVTLEERILSVRTGSVYGDKYNVRLTLANNIRDTAQNFVRIDNAIGSGVGKNSTGRYVSGRGGGGTGLSQTTVLDMLKKTETYITADEAWTREAGVKIESNASELYATKTSIFGNAFGEVEEINALIRASSENGGLVSMIVGRQNSVEDVEAGIVATAAGGGLMTLKVSKDGIISAINLTPEAVTIDASKINLNGYVTASQFQAEVARINNFFSGVSVISTINATRASIGTLQVGTYTMGWQKMTVVNSFTQASGETQSGDGVVLGVAAPAANAVTYTPNAGETITF